MQFLDMIVIVFITNKTGLEQVQNGVKKTTKGLE